MDQPALMDFSAEEVDANRHRWPVYPTNGAWLCLNCGCGSFSLRGQDKCYSQLASTKPANKSNQDNV